MALDPPITAEEEATVRLIRSLKAKRDELVAGQKAADEARNREQAARVNYDNLYRELGQQMRGIADPETVLREDKTRQR